MRRFLSSLFAARPARSPRRATARPQVEVLEEKAVPSSLTIHRVQPVHPVSAVYHGSFSHRVPIFSSSSQVHGSAAAHPLTPIPSPRVPSLFTLASSPAPTPVATPTVYAPARSTSPFTPNFFDTLWRSPAPTPSRLPRTINDNGTSSTGSGASSIRTYPGGQNIRIFPGQYGESYGGESMAPGDGGDGGDYGTDQVGYDDNAPKGGYPSGGWSDPGYDD